MDHNVLCLIMLGIVLVLTYSTIFWWYLCKKLVRNLLNEIKAKEISTTRIRAIAKSIVLVNELPVSDEDTVFFILLKHFKKQKDEQVDDDRY